MAAYDYTTTYYTTYFQFNSDDDTGHGNDNDKPFAVTSADTGRGSDAVVSVSFFFSDSDTGSGADASASPKVKNSDGGNGVEVATPGPQAADASHPAADNGGVTGGLFTLSDADSGSGAGGIPATGLKDGDITNAVEVDQISDSDTWSGSEQAQPAVTSADTGTGAEQQGVHLTGQADAFLGSDIGLNFAILPAAGDAGSGADTETQPALPVSSADTGSGADVVSSIFPAVFGSDSGSAAETQVLAAAVSSADAAAGTDISNVRPDADTGHSLDAARVGVGDADTISAAETSPVPNARVRDGDTAAGLDGGFVNTPSKFDGDTAHAAEGTPGLLVRQSSADTGGAAFEGSSVDLADILFGTEESFTLIRAAVLMPGTGAEQLALTGVRDGTMAPEYSAISQLGDDALLSHWINLTKVTVTVSGGFISFPALSLLLGYPVSADSNDRYSAAWGLRSMPASAEVPLVLRASSRDVRGRPRTLDFVLYRVRFTSLTIESFAYKTGAVASWTAEALFSYTDETGAPLSTDGTEQDIGRLVASPGQLPSPIPALFNGRRAVTVHVSGADTISVLDGKVNALPTAKSSAEAFSAIDGTGSINTGTSGADTGRAAESGIVTAVTLSSSDTAALLDGKPLATVRLVSDGDTARVSDGSVVAVPVAYMAPASNIGQMFTANANVTSLAFNTPGSYSLTFVPTASGVPDGLACSPVLKYQSYAQFQSDIGSGAITFPFQWVLYDPESTPQGGFATPQAEIDNPWLYMQSFVTLAHAHGFKVILTPARDLGSDATSVQPKLGGETLDQWYIRTNIAGTAAGTGAEVVEVQDQANQGTAEYVSFWNAAYAQIRASSGSCQAWAGVSTTFGTGDVMAAAAESVQPTATGFWLNSSSATISDAVKFLQIMEANVVLNGTAVNGVEAFHAAEAGSVAVSGADTGQVAQPGGDDQSVNKGTTTTDVASSDNMFNNEHPGPADIISDYITVLTGAPTKVAAIIGADVPAGTWQSANATLQGIQNHRVFFSSLPTNWNSGGNKLNGDAPVDGSVTFMISFKKATNPLTPDPNIDTFVASIPNVVPVWLIYNHEPENDSQWSPNLGSSYVAAFHAQSAAVRAAMAARADNGRNIRMVYTGSGYSYRVNNNNCQDGSFIPAPADLDYYCLDVYPLDSQQTAGQDLGQVNNFTLWIAALAAVGRQGARPLGFCEYGIPACNGNAQRNQIIQQDAAYLRSRFPAQGSSYGGTLGNGLDSDTRKISPFPMIAWCYWWSNNSGGVPQTSCAKQWMFTDAATVATWQGIEAGTI